MCVRGGVGGNGGGGVLDVCLRLGCEGVGVVGGNWERDLDQGLEVWCFVLFVRVVSPDFLCRRQVQAPV